MAQKMDSEHDLNPLARLLIAAGIVIGITVLPFLVLYSWFWIAPLLVVLLAIFGLWRTARR